MELTGIENAGQKIFRQAVEDLVNIGRDVGNELDKDPTSCHWEKLQEA
jgi:hypothetical protein